MDLTEGCGGDPTADPTAEHQPGPGAFVQMLSSMTLSIGHVYPALEKLRPQGNMLEMPVLQRHHFISHLYKSMEERVLRRDPVQISGSAGTVFMLAGS